MSETYGSRPHGKGSAARRAKPGRRLPADSTTPPRVGKTEVAAGVAVAVIVLAMSGLVWIFTGHAVRQQRAEFRDRTEQVLLGQASTFALTISHEVQLVDQSLKVLQSAWKKNSDGFDLQQWQQDVPALTSVAADVFIADDKHIIRQDTLPQAVGQGVGAAYAAALSGSLEHLDSTGSKDPVSLFLTSDNAPGFDARQYLVYVVRPLDHPKGWLVGASFRSDELPKLFAQASLGDNAIAALIDVREGVIQAILGPAARRPNLNLNGTQLYALLTRSPSGTWRGETPIDGVDRFIAFHRVPDRDMALIVGIPAGKAMALSDDIVSASYALAAVATALVFAAGALVLWELSNLRTHRRGLRILARNRIELERLRGDEATNIAVARTAALRLDAVLNHSIDGLAILDAGLRLKQWNPAFQQGIGAELRLDMPLASLLRAQTELGLLDRTEDIEAGIARYDRVLRAGEASGIPTRGPDGEPLTMRGLAVPESGLILVLTDREVAHALPAGIADTVLTEPAIPATADTPVEW